GADRRSRRVSRIADERPPRRRGARTPAYNLPNKSAPAGHSSRVWTQTRAAQTIKIAYMAKNFKDLSEAEILALATSNEETDGRIYADFAVRLKDSYPATAQVFKEMETEEDTHRRRLIDEFRRRFGEHIPLIRREDVKGFINRKPVWLIQTLGIDTVRRYAESMEAETQHFYERAAARVSDASTRKLLGDLAEAERGHVHIADQLEKEYLTEEARAKEDKAHRRLFVLQIVQPGLSGLMDGSVSTLAPVFAAAFATRS